MTFPVIYLLHGKGGSPSGSVLQLEHELRPMLPAVEFLRPLLPHSNSQLPAEDSVEILRKMNPPHGSLMIGISLGGLVAAKLQEDGRDDLAVISISSPTWADGVALQLRPSHRTAFYSSRDDVIADRVADWPRLADAYDLPWLTHDTDLHKLRLARLIAARATGRDLDRVVQDFKSC
ncbi:MAG: alpha/beta hydrolase [Acidobacteriaceae bacterium]